MIDILPYDPMRHRRGVREVLAKNGWEEHYIAGQLAGLDVLSADPLPGLAVSCDVTPEGTHVLCKRFERPSNDERGERLYGRDAQLVAAPDGKGEAVAFEIGIRLEDRVGGRVVGGLVHGVRACEVL